jgi:Tol biopolymer transport system component
MFIQDADTSDVWLLDLDAGGPPERLTTGRDPVPDWEDVLARISLDGSTVAYGDAGKVWLVAAAGGPARKLTESSSPVWIDNERLVISVERDETTRLAVLSTGDPWPRRLATAHGDLEEYGDEGEAVVSPDGADVAYKFTPRGDLNRSEIRVASLDSGAVRALTGTPRMHDREPGWSPDGTTVAYTSERSGFYEIHVAARDGSHDRQLTSARADHSELDWHPDGSRLLALRGRANRFDLVVVDAETGDAEVLARGGTWCTPFWTAAGDIVASYDAA